MTSQRRFGPRLENPGVSFRLWAPAAGQVQLITSQRHPMRRGADGWYTLTLSDARAGTRYTFGIDGEIEVPDPASAFQPDDVHGASEVIDHAYDWQAAGWRGRPWEEVVTLEIHVGTFTPAGSFRGVIERLDDIVATGITAIELMPVADFFGRWIRPMAGRRI
jgi:maltooligosyltrehalose trehalohydrolase